MAMLNNQRVYKDAFDVKPLKSPLKQKTSQLFHIYPWKSGLLVWQHQSLQILRPLTMWRRSQHFRGAAARDSDWKICEILLDRKDGWRFSFSKWLGSIIHLPHLWSSFDLKVWVVFVEIGQPKNWNLRTCILSFLPYIWGPFPQLWNMSPFHWGKSRISMANCWISRWFSGFVIFRPTWSGLPGHGSVRRWREWRWSPYPRDIGAGGRLQSQLRERRCGPKGQLVRITWPCKMVQDACPCQVIQVIRLVETRCG